MGKKVVAFGEIMLRLTPPDYTTISEAKSFIANYGGAEANVLVSLSHLGNDTDSYILELRSTPEGDELISVDSEEEFDRLCKLVESFEDEE